MTMRLLTLVLACLGFTSHANMQGSSSTALAQLLQKMANSPTGMQSVRAGGALQKVHDLRGGNMVDKISKLDESDLAVTLFSTAGLVLAGNELKTHGEKVKDMDLAMSVSYALVAANFMVALQKFWKAMQKHRVSNVLPGKVASLHEHEVAEVLFGTAALAIAIDKLISHWGDVKALEKKLSGAGAVTIAKFLDMLEKMLKAIKTAVGAYKSVR